MFARDVSVKLFLKIIVYSPPSGVADTLYYIGPLYKLHIYIIAYVLTKRLYILN